MALRQQWVFLPKQLQFFLDESRECLYSGAVRGGKTIALCRKVYKRALHRGAREFLARKELVTLRATTLKTLLEGDGEMDPVIPPGTYTHNKVEQEIRLQGGGEIVYFGLDNPTKIGSRTLSGGGVDEASEIGKDDWSMLYNRASLAVPGITRQINYACNPGPPEHWLAHRFGIVDASRRQPGCSLHTTKTADNHFLPRGYELELRDAYGAESLTYKRLVLGLWVGREGLVFSNFDRAVHIVDRSDVQVWTRTIVAIDDGIKDPFVALLISMDGLGALHVRRARYGHGMTSVEKEATVRALVGSERIEAVVVDPSAAQLKTDLAVAGWPIHDARNEVLPGIERVISALTTSEATGAPGLTFDPSCARSAECMATAPPHGQEPRSLVGEAESYAWKDRSGTVKEVPEHAWSHGPDALRYGVSHFQFDPIQIF